MIKNTSRLWLFGPREDFFVFSFPFILSFLLFLGHFYSIWSLSASIYPMFLAIILSDGVHVYLTYGLTYLDKKELQIRWKFYVFMPFVFILGDYFLASYAGVKVSYFFFACFSAYHFIRQQNAWFFICANKSSRTNIVKFFDIWGMRSITWGIIILSLIRPYNYGWFSSNDMFSLPQYFNWVLWPIVIFFICGYIIVNTLDFIRGRVFPVGKHNIFLFALLTWGTFRLLSRRLLDLNGFPEYSMLLLVFHHAFPYIYLCIKYLKENDRSLRDNYLFLNKGSYASLVLFVVTFAICFAYMENVRMFDRNLFLTFSDYKLGSLGMRERSVWIGISYLHYFMDGFFWKRSKNSKGREVLD